MDSLENVTVSGLTITLSPTQLLVSVGLLSVILISNAKSLLFAWHGRLFLQLARHFIFRRSYLTVKAAQHGAESLFAPVVTASYTPLLDIDYNLHKSNSTFFNDLDDNRTELLLALFKDVVKPSRHMEGRLVPKMFNLGGTSCIFKRAIAPLSRYEISSRILCWDQKWIYVVSHFTKPGSNSSDQLLLGQIQEQKGPAVDQLDCIYATAITKYVFKQGRKTHTPESVMQECGLLPPHLNTEGSQGLRNGYAKESNGHWSWHEVQEECSKHLKVAQSFDSLDQLHTTFIGQPTPVMYHY